ncbi:MAG: hypothetical protein ACE5QW_03230 [Thermoplasmata archaeon]
MKVLHYGNFSTVWTLREIQRKHGLEARVLDTNPSPLLFHSDYVVPHKLATDVMDKGVWIGYVLSIVRKFDIIHFHGGLGKVRARVATVARNLGKKIVVHYRGSDLRESLRAGFQHLADAIVVSTPDLKAFCKGATYIPNPVKPLPPRPLPDFPFKIVNAHTSRFDKEKVKGSDTIMRILRELESELGFEVIEVVDLPHEDAIARYSRAHVAVDSLFLGWYGVFAVECMLMGIPVLAHIDKTFGDPPLLSVTSTELRDALIGLADDKDEIERLGRIQRDYALAHHDPESVFRQVHRIYESFQ